MADADNEYRIKLVVDPTQATAGVDKTVADTERLKQQMAEATVVAQKYGLSMADAQKLVADMAREDQAAKFAAIKNELRATADAAREVGTASAEGSAEAAEAGEVFNSSVLKNRRSVGHLARGMAEMSQGGIAALGGLSSEAFVATEAFEGLLGPLAPFIMGLTLAASIGIPMFEHLSEKNEEANKKLEEGKDKADAMGDSIDTLASGVDEYKTASEAAVAAIIDAGKKQEEAFANGNKILEARVGLMQKAIDLHQKLTDAELDASENQELTANKDGPEGIERIEAKYAALKEGYKKRAVGEKLQNERGELIEKQHTLPAEIQGEKDRQANLQAELAKQAAAEDAAKAAAAKADLPTDKKSDYYEKLAEAKKKEIYTLQAQEVAAEAKLNGDGSLMNPGLLNEPVGPDPVIRLKHSRDVKAAQDELDQIDAKLAAATDQRAAATQLAKTSAATENGKGSKDLKTALDASAIKIQALEDQAKDNATKIEQLGIQIQTAALEAQNAQQALTLKQQGEALKGKNTDWEAENKSKIDQAEIDATNPKLSAQQRADATKRAGELRAQGPERKLVEGTPLNSFETKIPGREQEFQLWLAQQKANGIIAPDDNGNDQDYRGAFLNHEDPDSAKYAKPNSKKFTDQSIYAQGDQYAPWAKYAGKTQADGTVAPPEEPFPGVDTEHPLSPGQTDELRTEAKKDRAKSENKADKPKQHLRAEDTGTIANAETAVSESGGSQAQIQKAATAVQELSQGHAEGASQLMSILTELHGKVTGLTAAQKERDANMIEKLKVIVAELSQTTAAANSASAAVQAINTN